MALKTPTFVFKSPRARIVCMRGAKYSFFRKIKPLSTSLEDFLFTERQIGENPRLVDLHKEGQKVVASTEIETISIEMGNQVQLHAFL